MSTKFKQKHKYIEGDGGDLSQAYIDGSCRRVYGLENLKLTIISQ